MRMKKLLSLCFAALLAGSIMADELTITPDKLPSVTGETFSKVIDGIKLSVSNGTVTTDQIRIFKNATLTLEVGEGGKITKVVFSCTANGETKYGPGCFGAQTGYSFDGKVGTWTGEAASLDFTASSNQVRAESIVVTYVRGEDPEEDPGEGGYEYDYSYDDEEDFNQTFDSYTVDNSYLEDDGDLYIEAENKEGYYIALDIMVPENATELLPLSYTIRPDDETYPPQTVVGGEFYNNTTYGSYAATIVEDYLDRVWYLVSGTVTVAPNGDITVDAKNSLGKSVKALLKAAATPVANTEVQTNAAKTIMNGMLVIDKGGVKYNAFGQRINK